MIFAILGWFIVFLFTLCICYGGLVTSFGGLYEGGQGNKDGWVALAVGLVVFAAGVAAALTMLCSIPVQITLGVA